MISFIATDVDVDQNLHYNVVTNVINQQMAKQILPTYDSTLTDIQIC